MDLGFPASGTPAARGPLPPYGERPGRRPTALFTISPSALHGILSRPASPIIQAMTYGLFTILPPVMSIHRVAGRVSGGGLAARAQMDADACPVSAAAGSAKFRFRRHLSKSPIPPVPLADTAAALAVLVALGIDCKSDLRRTRNRSRCRPHPPIHGSGRVNMRCTGHGGGIRHSAGHIRSVCRDLILQRSVDVIVWGQQGSRSTWA